MFLLPWGSLGQPQGLWGRDGAADVLQSQESLCAVLVWWAVWDCCLQSYIHDPVCNNQNNHFTGNPFFYSLPSNFFLCPDKLVFKISFCNFFATLGLFTHPTKSCLLFWVIQWTFTCFELICSVVPSAGNLLVIGTSPFPGKNIQPPKLVFTSGINAVREPNSLVYVLARKYETC